MALANSSPLLSSLHREINEILGEVFFAVMTDAILFGITNVQAFIYFQNSKTDPNYLKSMVGLLWIFDAIQFFMVADYGYTTLVANFTNLLVVGKVTWSICWPILLEDTGNFIIRLFYIRRIWISESLLSMVRVPLGDQSLVSDRNILLSITAMVLNFVTLGEALLQATLSHWLISGIATALAFMAKLLHLQSFLEISTISWLMFTGLGSGLTADLWIAICVCYFLFKDKTGFQRTDTMLRKLTVYIIGSGLLTSFATVACFISYATMPNNGVYVAIYSCISKLYFNALLATLNTRKRLRGEARTEGSSSSSGVYHMFRIADMRARSGSTNGISLGMRSFTNTNTKKERMRDEVIAISVKTETRYRTDETETDLDTITSSIPI
ncbi:hypothetical protein ACEPAG_3862 [Sanghuangporus baumii]